MQRPSACVFNRWVLSVPLKHTRNYRIINQITDIVKLSETNSILSKDYNCKVVFFQEPLYWSRPLAFLTHKLIHRGSSLQNIYITLHIRDKNYINSTSRRPKMNSTERMILIAKYEEEIQMVQINKHIINFGIAVQSYCHHPRFAKTNPIRHEHTFIN